jgi:hypothetical protein
LTVAYYDALKTAWNAGATSLPTGVTGSLFAAGDTTAQKLTKINAWTVAGPAIPMVVQTYVIYNAIVPSEFQALSTTNQQYLRDILGMGTVDASAGTNVRAVIVAIFPSATQTFKNLAAIAAKYDTSTVPWWQSAGYTSTFSESDLTAAGGLS